MWLLDFSLKARFGKNNKLYNWLWNRVTRTVDPERLWSGIEELGLLMELVNFQV
jgi:hypothetical protein